VNPLKANTLSRAFRIGLTLVFNLSSDANAVISPVTLRAPVSLSAPESKLSSLTL